MKRLLRSCLLVIALAAWATACTKGGTSPDPVPSGPPTRWTGTASYTYELQTAVGSSTQRFDVTVTWVKDANPSPAPPTGGTRYLVASGAVHASWRQAVEIGRCTMEGDGDFPLAMPSPPADPEVQSLELGPDGQYHGSLYALLDLTYLQLCANGPSFVDRTPVELRLEIRGTRDGGRMHGEMQPVVLTTDALTSRRTGSWDFTAN